MATDLDRVHRALSNLDGERSLRNLLGRELGYEHKGDRISGDSYPDDLQEEPTLFATAGREGRFSVIHTRFKTPGKLSLMAERKVMEKLRNRYPYALYVFSEADNQLWHFVNAPHAERAGDKQYRRIVVGTGEPSRTAIERISMLSVDDLADERRVDPDVLSPLDIQSLHDKAFDVEEVTKRFFQKYEQVFKNVEAGLTGITRKEDVRYFTQRLLNRLMFVAFIEQKGWLSLNGQTDYLRSLLSAYKGDRDRNGSFYTSRLKPLFFQGFNTENREDEKGRIVGTVPYLNGGLFEEDKYDTDERVDVPDECFDEIIHRLFGGFNFTTTESTPLDVEVAVDPEMLGQVFEKLVTGRHETGSYYTPKPIVSFMCREAIKGHLGAKLPEDSVEAVNAFVDDHDPSGLHNPEAVLTALQDFTVCDPACGSGAYLLGMLHELLDLRESLFRAHELGARLTYDRKLQIIQKNIYGVDIDPFAVNIARLRLWLSLVVDFEGRIPPPLPNLDFKIESGDSLTGLAPSGGSETPDLIRNGQVQEYFRLKSRYLEAHGLDKTLLREQIESLRKEIVVWAHPGQEAAGFDWPVEFAEVFAEDGFDVILANPPYVRADAQFRHLRDDSDSRQVSISRWKRYRDTLRDGGLYQTLYEKWDLYLPFLERAYQLLRADGQMIFIVSDAYNASKYAQRSHDYFVRNSRIVRIDFCSDIPLFSAGVSNTVLHFMRSEPTASDVPLRIRHWGDSPEHFHAGTETLNSGPQKELGAVLFRPDNFSDKSAVEGAVELQRICYISVGMVTNSDERKYVGAFNTQDLISDVRDSTHPKPFVQGKDLFKWCVRQVRFLEWGTQRAPAMFRRQTFPELYDVPEKLIAVKVSPEPRIAYDQWRLAHTDGLYSFVPWHYLKGVQNRSISKTSRYRKETKPSQAPTLGYREDLEDLSQQFRPKYLLAVMNSTFAKRWLSNRRRNKLQLYPNDWKQLPIAPASERDQADIGLLVDKVLALYEEHGYPLPGNLLRALRDLEQELDNRVAALYGLNKDGSDETLKRL